MKLSALEKAVKKIKKIKIKKTVVKVPVLKLKENVSKNKPVIPISTLIKLLIKNSIEEAKSKEKKEIKEDKKYIIKEEKPESVGGYGTTTRNYGISPISSYVDYAKIFSYLGKFRARNAYESADALLENTSVSAGSLDKETMETGARFIRYMITPTARKDIIDTVSLVPIAGMNSSEWEQFKLWSKLDAPMYFLKLRTS